MTTTPATRPKLVDMGGEIPLEVGKTLAAKLAFVAGEIDRVAKRGRNREQGYTFAAAGDIFDEIRGKLAAQRVALRWSIDREATHLDAVESKGGAKGLFATLWITYTFVDGDNGTEFAYYTVGTANDYPGDKAVYKAQTNALKYLLTQTFLVSTGDDVEADGKPDEQAGATYARRPPPPPPPAAPVTPSVPLTEQQKKLLTSLGNTLTHPWDKDRYAQEIGKRGFLGTREFLLSAHRTQHGEGCPHFAEAVAALGDDAAAPLPGQLVTPEKK